MTQNNGVKNLQLMKYRSTKSFYVIVTDCCFRDSEYGKKYTQQVEAEDESNKKKEERGERAESIEADCWSFKAGWHQHHS